MKYLLIFLVSCSGEAFTIAQPDAKPLADPPTDAGSQLEVESQLEVDSAADTGQAADVDVDVEANFKMRPEADSSIEAATLPPACSPATGLLACATWASMEHACDATGNLLCCRTDGVCGCQATDKSPCE